MHPNYGEPHYPSITLGLPFLAFFLLWNVLSWRDFSALPIYTQYTIMQYAKLAIAYVTFSIRMSFFSCCLFEMTEIKIVIFNRVGFIWGGTLNTALKLWL